MEHQTKIRNFYFMSWLVASIATMGSLYFSEVMKFPPCSMCWYQRIAMYPLVVVFLVGNLNQIKETRLFAMPIAVIGWLLALYHNLLHYEIVPESAAPCMQGVSCSTVYVNWFGFLTIPMLSFIAFSVLLVLMFLIKREETK